MNASIVSILIFAASLRVSAQITENAKLPDTWTKNFVIRVSYSGSMDGSRTDLTFTYDSCKYIRKSGMKAPETSVFALTESNRAEILKKLKELKVADVKSEVSPAPVNDGWLTSMCFGNICMSEGPTIRMSDHDKEVFSNAYGFLESFAEKKTRR